LLIEASQGVFLKLVFLWLSFLAGREGQTKRRLTSFSRWAIKLEVQPEQRLFVPIVAVCLAKVYIKPGDGIVIPYGIYPGDTMVGFLRHYT